MIMPRRRPDPRFSRMFAGLFTPEGLSVMMDVLKEREAKKAKARQRKRPARNYRKA